MRSKRREHPEDWALRYLDMTGDEIAAELRRLQEVRHG